MIPALWIYRLFSRENSIWSHCMSFPSIFRLPVILTLFTTIQLIRKPWKWRMCNVRASRIGIDPDRFDRFIGNQGSPIESIDVVISWLLELTMIKVELIKITETWDKCVIEIAAVILLQSARSRKSILFWNDNSQTI